MLFMGAFFRVLALTLLGLTAHALGKRSAAFVPNLRQLTYTYVSIFARRSHVLVPRPGGSCCVLRCVLPTYVDEVLPNGGRHKKTGSHA